MKAIERFERWAGKARKEPAPGLDVADAVMLRLCRVSAPTVIAPPPWMWVTAAASVAAAAVFGVMGYTAWIEMNAPGVSLLQEISSWGTI
jgi:hypothetical protein